jgi:hypothetical protein
VRSIVIHGCTIVIETKPDGTVLVNGDLVEPIAVTLQRFRDETCADAHHANVLRVTEPGRNLVLAHSARRDPPILTSVKDLGRKLMRYIREHNKDPKPVKWKYDDPSRRIRPVPIH